MDNQENYQGYELDIKRIVTVLWRRIWIVLLAGALLAAAAFSYALFFVTPIYTAGAKIYVNNVYDGNNGAYSPAQLTGAQQLAKTYMVILGSRPVLEKVQEKSGLQYTQNQLKGMISAESINETEVFQITVTSTKYQHAAKIAAAITEVLPEAIGQVVEGSSIRVVEYPIENPTPAGPSYSKYILLGAAIGVLLSAVIIVVLDLMDTSVETESYLTSKYEEIPLLAVIPCDESEKNSYHKGYYAAENRR